MNRKYIYSVLAILIFFFEFGTMLRAEEKSVVLDSTTVAKIDSIKVDTIAKKTKKNKNKIDFPITYSANDSIVLYQSGNAFMYGEGNVKYDKIELTANYIHLNTDSFTVDASGIENKDGEIEGEPIFKDGGEEYEAKSLRYNYNTKKGFIHKVVVQQGEGYIVGSETKRLDEEYLCMKNGRYTTCDDHEHPHFYLNLTKAKVKQNKWVVTGPAYMVLLDVPLPLVIPFGYFPFTKSYSSGVIVPSFGDELTRGFYLTHGGYYFAINDYFDLELTGDIYTKGTWAVNLASSYVKRYMCRGNVKIDYRNDVYGEKGSADYSKNRNFSVVWTHTQDPKSMPNSTFSASVNFSTSGYDRSNIDNYYNPSLLSQNTKSSSVSFSHNFPETPFSISASVLASQRTSDSTLSLTLPDLTITMSRTYPFKRKNKIGKDRWYEKIYISYSGNISNRIEVKEDKIFKTNLLKDWQNGWNHSIPIGASFNVFRYLNLTPTINYKARWYLQQVTQEWDYTAQEVKKDTIGGKFASVRDFSVGISASTKLYGFYTPIRKIFGDKIDRIRHVFTPSVSFTYKPDFGTDFWGYYKSYMRPVDPNDSTKGFSNVRYSPFASAMYGVPAAGQAGSVSFSLNNNLEMKVKQKNDSTDEAKYRTISLIDAFNISSSYNIAADSLRWSNILATLRLKITKGFTLNVNTMFDPYMLGKNEFGNPVHIDELRSSCGKPPRLINASTSFSYTFNNQTFSRKKDENENENSNPQGLTAVDQKEEMAKANERSKKEEKEEVSTDDDGYTKVKIPWSLSFDYSLRYGNTNEFDESTMEYKRELTHNLGVRGTLSLTSKWNFSLGLSYDFNNKQITYSTIGVTRNLHCWSMSANIVPFGLYKSYNFTIQVNASMLSDLKYDQRSDNSIMQNWY